MRSIKLTLFLLLGVVAWYLCAGDVRAQAVPYTPSTLGYTATGGKLVPGTISGVTNASQWAANSTAGAGVRFTENVAARVAANDVAMVAARTIPWGAVAAAAGKALPLVGLGFAAYDIYTLVHCRFISSIECLKSNNEVVPAYWVGDLYWLSAADACTHWAMDHLGPGRDNYFTFTQGTASVVSVNGQTYCQGTQAMKAINHPPDNDYVAHRITPVGLVGSMCADGTQLVAGGCIGQDEWKPASASDVGNKIAASPDALVHMPEIAKQTAKVVDLSPDALPAVLTGPATYAEPPVVTTVTPLPTPAVPVPVPVTATENNYYNFDYEGDHYTYTTTHTATDPTGTTTVIKPPAAPPLTCGLPGSPACAVKVDESGTPKYVPPTDILTDMATRDAQARNDTAASVKEPSFGFIGAPPLAECESFQYPDARIPPLNPCGVVDGVRGVMAYIWALAAAWLAIGMIRKTVTGGG